MAEWYNYWDALRKAGACPPGHIQASLDLTGTPADSSVIKGIAVFSHIFSNQYVAYQAATSHPLVLSIYPAATAPGMYIKVSQLLSIAANTKYQTDAAEFVSFLVTNPGAVKTPGFERGVPVRHSFVSKKEKMILRTSTPEAVWPGKTWLPSLPQTTRLEIYDVRAFSPEMLLSVTTLAGLINRGAEKIYLLENSDDEFWLTQIDPALPRVYPDVATDRILDHLLQNYRELLVGLVIYDPSLLDTRNVASTLAALRAGLVVEPELAERLQKAPYNLPVLADLQVHGWKSRLQAYTWAYQELLADCSPDLFAGLDPRLCGSLRSFLVTQRVFTCWLDTRDILPDPFAGWTCERGLFRRVLARFHPGAFHLGWFINEPSGIRLTSRAALLTLASDHCTNLAIWSSLPVDSPENDQAAGNSEDAATLVREDEAVDGKTIYLSFTISDGDNLQYCQHHLLRLWHDSARGRLPLGWTIAPALQQIMPCQAAFYRRTLAACDVLIAGPSGAAYILPSYWPRQHRVAFLELTAASLQAMSLTVLQILDSRTWLSWFSMRFLDPDLQELFAGRLGTRGLRGVLSGAGSLRPSWCVRSGVPIYQNLGLALNPGRTRRLIQREIGRGTRFINVYVFAWQTSPGDLLGIVQELGSDVRVVTPERLLDLVQRNSS